MKDRRSRARRSTGPVTAFAAAALLVGLAAACLVVPTPPPLPPPILPPVATPTPASHLAFREVTSETFDQGFEGWTADAGQPAQSTLDWLPSGHLEWSVELAPQQGAWLVHPWPALAEAHGVGLHLTSLDRDAFLLLGLHEADGSVYNVSLYLDAGKPATHMLAWPRFGLQEDSHDENSRLDGDQLAMLSLTDIGAFMGAPTANRILIDEVVTFYGMPETPDLMCAPAPGQEVDPVFRVGVDGNYVPQGERGSRGFYAGDQLVDPLQLFAAHGANAFRLRLWVGDWGESRLRYATDLAHRAQEAGMRPYVVLFLHDNWTDVSKQPAPSTWARLSLSDRAETVRTYARQTAGHLISQGIEVDFYEIGNEIDYGICGVFADDAQRRDETTLRAMVWPEEALLLRAAVEGLREADPQARMMLHIATSWDPGFAVAFFRSMDEFGVPYNYVGLSYYPTAFGLPMASRLCSTLDRLTAEVGKPIVIAECAYAAEPPSGGLFAAWRHALPGYPLTPEGQAWWLSDFLHAMSLRGDVMGVYYFSPGFWFSGELWGPFALFDNRGQARPSVASLSRPAR